MDDVIIRSTTHATTIVSKVYNNRDSLSFYNIRSLLDDERHVLV